MRKGACAKGHLQRAVGSATLEAVAGRPVARPPRAVRRALRSSQEASSAAAQAGTTVTTPLDQCAGVDLQDLIVAPTKEDARGIAAAARIERVVAFRVYLRRGRLSAG